MDKRVETCGQESGDLWTRERRLVNKRVETCGQGSGDLLTREGRLVDKGVDTREQESKFLWIRAVSCGQEIFSSSVSKSMVFPLKFLICDS